MLHERLPGPPQFILCLKLPVIYFNLDIQILFPELFCNLLQFLYLSFLHPVCSFRVRSLCFFPLLYASPFGVHFLDRSTQKLLTACCMFRVTILRSSVEHVPGQIEYRFLGRLGAGQSKIDYDPSSKIQDSVLKVLMSIKIQEFATHNISINQDSRFYYSKS